MTKQEVKRRIKGLDADTAKGVVCACVGHSKVVSLCFGYVSCARCGEQIGDSLAGSYPLQDCVIVGHDCDYCRINALTLDWTDTFLVNEAEVFPNPAKEVEAA